ncbi:hypothetical protein RUM43_011642 [Polyplax serrata]|uniref:SCP domain-containing protein n=1 Tax=Polyplax serrata TaxID=468196 RepID=A0AAN8P8M9_POLSC
MATKTSTETKREITRRGDVIIIKEVEKTTTYAPGKEPVVKEITRVEEYKDTDDYKRLPDDIRRQLRLNIPEKAPTEMSQPNKTATDENFAQECLAEHNKIRKMHGVEPLKLSPQLMKVSEQRAQELASKDIMTTKPDHLYGENLSCMWSSDPAHVVNAVEIVSRWYAEEKKYNYSAEPKNLNAGHFTQMVWARSTEFGVAAAKSKSNRIYVVASYNPPGNYVGEFKMNVHPKGAAHVKELNDTEGDDVEASVAPPGIQSNGQSSDAEMSDFNREGLAYHNECRRRHGVPPLVYSSEVKMVSSCVVDSPTDGDFSNKSVLFAVLQLAKYAQEWAEELARLDRMEHRKNRKYGENLYCFKSTNCGVVATASQACKSWYNEIKNYDFDCEPRSLSTGHFTQMVWRTTRELGMGLAKSNSGLQLIVANYNPPGNYLGTFRVNCPRPME